MSIEQGVSLKNTWVRSRAKKNEIAYSFNTLKSFDLTLNASLKACYLTKNHVWTTLEIKRETSCQNPLFHIRPIHCVSEDCKGVWLKIRDERN